MSSKCLCCSLDLTIASRIIACFGVVISMILVTVLLNDKYYQTDNYDMSRKIALALGLDWQHFHKEASTSYQNDPEGKMITILMMFYSTVFLIINLLLFFATIRGDWYCAIPWLIIEFIGCLSKFGALVYHLYCEPFHLSSIFIGGSVVYIVVMIWWWLLVFLHKRAGKMKNLQRSLN